MKIQNLILLIVILVLATSFLRLGKGVINYYDTYYVFYYDSITRALALVILVVLFIANLVRQVKH